MPFVSSKIIHSRKELIYQNYLKTKNMAETGRIFGVTREYVRQVVNQFKVK
jgi:hypothetical protein